MTRPSVGHLMRVANAATTGLGRHAARQMVFATLTPQPLLRRLAPRLVVDVGANRGQFALDVRQAVPAARIVSFEPLASEADVYDVVMSRERNCELHRCAIGPESGSAEIVRSRAADSSSLLEISDLQVQRFPGTEECGREDVEVERLDNFISEADLVEPALLKIDVQGYEYEVLQSAGPLLAKFTWIYVEVSFAELYVGQHLATDIIAFLAGEGFQIADVPGVARHKGAAIQADVLFGRVDSR